MDNQKIQEHVQTVREALKQSSEGPFMADEEKWPGNDNLQYWVQDHMDGIGAFVRYEDAFFAANSPTWLQQSIEIIEQQQREIEGHEAWKALSEASGMAVLQLEKQNIELCQAILANEKTIREQQREIERLNSRIESLEKGWDTNG